MPSIDNQKFSCIQKLVFQTSNQEVWQTIATFKCPEQTLDALRVHSLDEEVRALLDHPEEQWLGYLTIDFTIKPTAKSSPA